MTSVLYYSNFCEPSKRLLSYLTKLDLKIKIHYICIDNRVVNNGQTYILLNNNQKIILPEIIKKVPSLFLINNQKILLGNDIYDYLKPHEELSVKVSTNNEMEPSSYELKSSYGNSISSDNFSFWDMETNDLSAKGDGGLRQMHTYASLNHNESINTPEENYDSKKIGDVSIEQLQNKRLSELKN